MPYTSPFIYPEVKAPLTGTITDIISRAGDPYARAAMVSGQAWGQAAQNIGQDVSGAIQQVNDPRRQLAQQEVEANRRTQTYTGAVNQMVSNLMQTNPDGTRTLDRAKLQQQMAAGNVPLPVQQQTLKALDDVDTSVQKFTQQRIDHTADLAHGAITMIDAGMDPHTAVAGALAYGKANGITRDQDMDQIAGHVATLDGPGVKQFLLGVRGLSEKYKEMSKPVVLPAGRPGAPPPAIIEPSTGRTIAGGGEPTPEKPTEASLANAAAGGDPARALELLHAQKNPPSMQEQLLEAMSKGDTTRANQITSAIQADARAKQDPAAARLATELRNLSIDQAKERLKAEREKNAPIDISGSVNKTMSGRQYIDLSEWQTPEDRQKAQRAAVASGVIPVNKDTAGMLSDLDTARQNQQTMIRLVESKLPKDASGRLLKGPANTIKKLAQTDPDLASIGTFRNAAIQSMRAVAGSKGLRINQAEVQLAIDNDIPKLSDTLDSARQKLANLSAFMENIEKAHLVRDRSALTGADAHPQPAIPTIPLTPGLVELAKRP